ncbi:MAG: metallophosphoesterase family protein [Calditrichaeota bacterium]|nr:metallophosphoesterase family protein [Calditrichota bacterium]
MRYGFIADVHGNLEALTAVLDDLRDRNIDEIICLGDSVGYGPDPNACVALIRENTRYALLGNHDSAAIGKTTLQYFNLYARQAIEWTREILDADSYSYLSSLPLKIIIDDMTLVHSTPKHPEEWNYLFDTRDAIENFNYFRTRLCFIGHSHRPVAFFHEGERYWISYDPTLLIRPKMRGIINVGSVGQPRDGDPRACYGIYDEEDGEFQYIRVPYDVEKTQAKMRKAGLPDYLIHRLFVGR